MDGRKDDVNVQSHISFFPPVTHLTDPLPEQQIRPLKVRNIRGPFGNLVFQLAVHQMELELGLRKMSWRLRLVRLMC